jgi:PAS domain S-box-containing protein
MPANMPQQVEPQNPDQSGGRSERLPSNGGPGPAAERLQLQVLSLQRALAAEKRGRLAYEVAHARLQFLVSATPVILYTRRPTGDFGPTFVSDNVLPQLGYRPQDIVGVPQFWRERIHPEDAARVLAEIGRIGKEEQQRCEYRLRHEDGSYRWIVDEMRLVRDSHGDAVEMVGYWIDITERKRTEEALQASEQRFALFMKHLPGVAFVKDTAGRYIYFSDRARDVTGRETDELTGKTDEDLWPAPTARRLRSRDLEVLSQGKPLQTVETAPQRDGKHYWLVSKFPLPDRDHHTTVVAGIGIDITDHKHAEQALRESERFARATIDALPSNLCVVDADGRIVAVNRAWTDFAAANGASAAAIQPPVNYLSVCEVSAVAGCADAGKFACGLRRVLAGEQEQFYLEYECPSPSEQRWFVGRVTRFAGDGPVRAVITHTDITARRMAERAVQQGEERLNSILDSLNDVVWSLAPGTHEPLYLNAAADRLYGRPRDAFLKDRNLWLEVVHPDDRERVLASFPGFLRDGANELEYRIVRPDGEARWVRDRGRVIRSNGEVVRLDGTVTDITELKSARDAVRDNAARLKRLAAHLESVREEQSAAIAREVHDELGGTLTVLKLGLASLQRKLDQPDKASEQVESLVGLVATAMGTVKRVSSRLRPDTLDTLGLAVSIRRLAGDFSQLTGIATDLRLPRLPRLAQDRSIAIYRIVQEALTNIARHARASHVRIKLGRRGEDLLVELVDDGRGVGESELEKPDSYGILGMRERTQYLGGELSIRGSPGRGTAVKLRVPLARQSAGAS